jgi:hypothetical protein
MMQRRVVIAIALATLGISACIIGPKQDDPAPGTPTKEHDDASIDVGNASDTGDPFSASDTAPTDTALPPAPLDAGSDSPSGADAPVDAACPDGGVRITAIGPWNETKKCWEPTTHYFDCQDGSDGGTAFTCFERVSTMEKFLAPTTVIPAGPDYRLCGTPGGSGLDRCK